MSIPADEPAWAARQVPVEKILARTNPRGCTRACAYLYPVHSVDVCHKHLWRTTGEGHELQPTALSASIRPSDLEDYFEQRDIRFPARLDWKAAPAKSYACLKAAIEALPDMHRERVFDDFERIDQLTDDIGQCSLLAVAEPDGGLLRRFQHLSRASGPRLAGIAGERGSIRPCTCDRLCRAHAVRPKLERLPIRGPLRQAAIRLSSCSKQTCARYSGNLMAPGAS